MTEVRSSIYHFPAHIHHVNIDGELVILDEHQDKYIVLDEKQTSDVVSFMARERSSPIGEILLREGVFCHSSGEKLKSRSPARIGVGAMKWSSSPNPSRAKISARYALHALYHLLAVQRRLKQQGFQSALQTCRSACYIAQTQLSAHNRFSVALQCSEAIKYICPLVPWKTQCLEHSLTLHAMLARKNIDSKLLIGVQRYDFLSHAWVEVDGNVVDGPSDLRNRLSVILEIGA